MKLMNIEKDKNKESNKQKHYNSMRKKKEIKI